MQIGMMGLGRMGANMVRRLMQGGHECVVYDISAEAVAGLIGEGATGAGSVTTADSVGNANGIVIGGAALTGTGQLNLPEFRRLALRA